MFYPVTVAEAHESRGGIGAQVLSLLITVSCAVNIFQQADVERGMYLLTLKI